MQFSSLHVTVFVAVAFAVTFLFVQTSLPTSQDSYKPRNEAGTIVLGSAGVKGLDVLRQERSDEQVLRQEQILVSVDAYVEALCPDSARFVVYDLDSEHFPPSLWDVVDVKYHFWGNARTEVDGNVHCQHGEAECEINTLLQCAISIASTSVTSAAPPSEPPVSQKLASCYFAEELQLHGRAAEAKAAAISCVAMAGIPLGPVRNCATDGLNSAPSRSARAATEALSPPHTWVPWVTVNGSPINAQELGDAANVARAACEALPSLSRPVGCTAFLRNIGSNQSD